MAGRILPFRFWFLSALFLLSSTAAYSENRMNLGFSCTGVTSCDNNIEALPPTKPGKKKKFTVEIQKSNGSDTGEGTSELLSSGFMKFGVTSSSATGRLTSATTYNRNNREGLSLDSFLIFRSFFSDSYFNVLSSTSSCKDTPASPQNYNWVIFRGRSPQSISNKIYANDTAYKFAGVVSVNSATSSILDGTGAIDLNTLSLDNTGYNYSPVSGTSCSVNTQKLNADSSNQPLGAGASIYWGDNSFVAISRGANPNVALGIPQTNLTSQYLAELAGNSFSGMMYYQSAVNSATFKTLLISSVNSGTQFNIQELSDFSNASTATSWGSLTCSDLNSPAQGFCKGTLTKNGQTGNALCAFGTIGNQGVMACTAQLPSNTAMPIYFFGTYPARANLTFSSPVLRGLASSQSCGDVTVTNTSGRIATGFSLGTIPSGMSLGPNAYDGQSGRCSSSVAPFSSCTVPVCATIQNSVVNAELSISYEENPTATETTQAPLVYEQAPQPVVTLSADASTGNAPLTVNFTADASVGTITNWFWDFGDGTFDDSGAPSITHTYANGGSYTASVYGVDSYFQSSNSATVGITANLLPTISAIYTNSPGEIGLSGNNFDSVTQIEMGLTGGPLSGVTLLYQDNTFIAFFSPSSNGNYTVSLNGGVVTSTFDYQPGCSFWGYSDNDSDGVCSDSDCDDNNSTFSNDCSSNIVLSLPMNGSNGSSTFTDDALAHSFSPHGNPQLSTSVGKFGGASGHFTRSNQDHLQTDHQNNEFNFGTGDFTIEAWINSESLVDSSIVAGSGWGDWMFAIGQNGGFELGFGQNGISWDATSSSLSWSTGQWNHVAATRQNGTLRLFFNGEEVYEGSNSVSYGIYGVSPCNELGASLLVGARQDCLATNLIGQFFDGHLDEIRIIKGFAKYTNSFTPESCSDRGEGTDEGCGCGMGTACQAPSCPTDGWCTAENAYYIGGVSKPGLDAMGSGSCTDGYYYSNAQLANGLASNGFVYVNGLLAQPTDGQQSVWGQSAENGYLSGYYYFFDGRLAQSSDGPLFVNGYNYNYGSFSGIHYLDAGQLANGLASNGYVYYNGRLRQPSDGSIYIVGSTIENGYLSGTYYFFNGRLAQVTDGSFYFCAMVGCGTYFLNNGDIAYGLASNGYVYSNGRLAQPSDGQISVSGMTSEDGYLMGTYYFVNGRLAKLSDGMISLNGYSYQYGNLNGSYYLNDGQLAHGILSNGRYYQNGYLGNGLASDGYIYSNGDLAQPTYGQISVSGMTSEDGYLMGTYYFVNGRLAKLSDGLISVNGYHSQFGSLSGNYFLDNGQLANGLASNGYVYSNGQLAQPTHGQISVMGSSALDGFLSGYYLFFDGRPLNGVYNSTCYWNGQDTMSLSTGTGYCSGDSLYYVNGVVTTLDSSGNGTWNGQTYTAGVLKSIITINTQPSNQTASGGSATFSVAASVTNSESLSYQWQKQESGSGDFNNVSGATNNSLSLSSLTDTDDNGDVYRVVVSASGGAEDVTSNSATLTVPAASSGGDPFYDDVTLLLHLDGNMTDSSSSPRTASLSVPSGDTTEYSSSVTKFGSHSVHFSGNPVSFDACEPWGCWDSTYARIGVSNMASKLPGKFTVEFWIKPDSTWTSGYRTLFQANDASGMGMTQAHIYYFNGTLRFDVSTYDWNTGAQWYANLNRTLPGSSLSTDWHHIAGVREDGNIAVYLDGQRLGTPVTATLYSGYDGNTPAADIELDFYGAPSISFGAGNYGSMWPTSYNGWAGHMDDIRISNRARYTGTSYDIPTTAFANSKQAVAPLISLSTTNYTLTAGTAISAIIPSVTMGTISTCAISPDLPTGLSFNTSTCGISGTPTYGGPTTSYTISPTNEVGAGNEITLSIAINGINEVGYYYSNGSLGNGLVADHSTDKTVLLLHMDGVNGSTTFTDSSQSSKSLTANGGVAVSSTQSKFGGGSGFFSGASNTDLRTPVTNSLNFGTGDFAMEAWIYLASLTYPTDHQLVVCSSDYGGLCFGFIGNGTQLGIARRNIAWDLLGNVSITANTWYHIAATRENGTARVFLNGNLVASGANTQNYTFGTTLHVGSHNGSHYYNGYIDDLRLVKGAALYTSNFTPPTSAVGTGATYGCYSNGIDEGGVDSSGTGYCSTTGTYYIAGTAYDGLDMTGSGVSGGLLYSLGQLVNGYTANNCYFNGLNTGEVSGGNGWCSGDSTYYLSGSPTTLSSTGNGIHDGLTYSNGSLANGFIANHDNDNTVLLLHMNGSNNSTTFTDSSANNLSAVKAMTSLGGSKGCSPQGDESGANFLGETFGTSQHGGNCPNWCQTNYPTTKCSQMYATWAYSGGHCSCWSSSTSYDWPGWGDREVWMASDTKISTAQSKFGGSSAYFDGSGDYITYQSSTAFAFGLDDFSVEFWMKASSFGGTRAMVTTAEPSDQYGFWVGLSNNSLYWLMGNGSWGFSRTPVAVDNSWHHVALTRQSGMARLFLDGNLVDSVSYPTTLTNPNNAVRVGGRPIGSQYFHGYLDEIRITKGAALYTANFTPPASALGTGAVYGCYTNGSSAGGVDSSGTGYCLFNNTYYIAGTAYAGLDSSGTGTSGGLKYSAGSLYNGFDGSSCYVNGAATSDVASGNGWCSGDNTYYLSSMPTTLSASGNGTHNGQPYSNGSPANGFVVNHDNDKTVLLLHMDGSHNSTTFTDSSGTPKTLSTQGDAKLSTTQSKFGGASLALDGSGDYLQISDSDDFAFGTGDFTVELFVRLNSLGNPFSAFLNTQNNINWADSGKWYFGHQQGYGLVFGQHTSGNIAYTSWTPALNTWYHVAASRHNGTMYLAIDGVNKSVSNANIHSGVSFDLGEFTIGALATPYYTNGYIDEVRITKGQAIYTSSFTLPANQLGTVGSVYGCYSYGSDLGSIDSSGTGYCSVNSTYYVNGAPGTGVYNGNYYVNGAYSSPAAQISVYTQPYEQTASAGTATFTISAGIDQAATLSYQWQRQAKGTGSFTNIAGATSDTLTLAGLTTNKNDGDIYRVVLTGTTGASSVTSNGVALSVPVGESADGDSLFNKVTLLLHLDGDATDSSSSPKDSALVYNDSSYANYSSADAQFGSALCFSGQYSSIDVCEPWECYTDVYPEVKVPLNSFKVTPQWTLEFWFKPDSTWTSGGYKTLFAAGDNYGMDKSASLYYYNGNIFFNLYSYDYWNYGTWYVNMNRTVPGSSISAGWHHVAVVRDAGNFTIYFDGAPLGPPGSYGADDWSGSGIFNENYTVDFLGSNSYPDYITFGASYGGYYGGSSGGWAGCMDEIRITEDMRYNDAFTPDTLPFPDSGI